MGHDHGHDHTHGANKKVLLISFIIITLYMIVEAIGGFLTNSLALLADAGHMLSDAISLGIALLAFTFGARAANRSKTFGYKRFEILAAVLNGLLGNILVALIMMRSGDLEENLIMRGAYMHVISDMLGSIGAIIAALLIMFFGWGWADPLASVIVAALVLRSGYFVTKAGLHVLMEGTPENVDFDDVIETIQRTKGIEGVHDLHVWSITSGLNALSCHAVVDERMSIAESERLLRQIEHNLEHQNIHHMTIQLETSAHLHDNSILCKAEAESSGHHHHH